MKVFFGHGDFVEKENPTLWNLKSIIHPKCCQRPPAIALRDIPNVLLLLSLLEFGICSCHGDNKRERKR